MKKVYFLFALAVAAITLSSCDAYNNAVDTHNRIVDRYNNGVRQAQEYLNYNR